MAKKQKRETIRVCSLHEISQKCHHSVDFERPAMLLQAHMGPLAGRAASSDEAISSAKLHDKDFFVDQKSKFVRLPREAYRPEMIIRAIIHERNLDRISWIQTQERRYSD